MNKLFFLILICIVGIGSSGCNTNTVADLNVAMPQRNWSYVNKLKVGVDVKDVTQRYNIYFKLRHTTDYRYANIFVLFRLKGPDGKTVTRRMEYRLAQVDGQWLGSGSGNLYTYELPLLTNFSFPVIGKYELEVEQNMRDNPLKEISDGGLTVSTK
ncbi:gliding motility lipoprotein GldH [Pedobacter duraquae]|uniref:Gliding motility-associated lipoprotein GldH n=1 Tax=Pedobacter duraquae TaxID=425511 RepID=A0A4R6IBH9_9SPHI|nr:gliding motility lipoprotein GldH [Pedobacter duraquae]TDO19292.1 gliding motility-associated lipoprotein GldH [Pedobacter duraquae]